MAEPVVPVQPGSDPNANNQPEPNTPVVPAPAAGATDLSKLTGDELNKVLENPELFKLPRIKELMDNNAEYKKLVKQQEDNKAAALKEQGKFEELAANSAKENETLRDQLKSMNINQALASKLVPLGVVDLDGALKLADRANLDVDENGNVKGLDEAIEALKKDRSYLFGTPGTPTIGSPTNPANGGGTGTPSKFKSSQMTPEFYKANEKAILEAYAVGLVEDDGSPT